MSNKIGKVLVTGGAGYVGSELVPALLSDGYEVTVLDLYMYGKEPLDKCRGNPSLREIEGDLRDKEVVARAVEGCDAVIHLACISNDPSFELDPALGRSINFDAFHPLVLAAKRAGASRFIYASSSSVYGIKDDPEVTEDLPLEPLTDYSRFKAMCEDILSGERGQGFATLVIRPATVCGYGARLRLDLTVNILTNHAINKGKITVFGGQQKRPNIHIADMVDLYRHVLALPCERIDGGVYNAGYENHTVMEIAKMVQSQINKDLTIEVVPTNDNRSYHVSSRKMREQLGFLPHHSIEDAVKDLKRAFTSGLITDPMNNPMYYNIKRMQELRLR